GDHRIGGHRCPVEQRPDFPWVEPELTHAFHDAEVETRGRRGHLGDPRLAGVADGEHIRERAACVAADDPAHQVKDRDTPPSTSSTCPVTYEASSLARNKNV